MSDIHTPAVVALKNKPKYLIIALDILIFLGLLKWLPFDPEVVKGLAVLVFVAILWLTEALHLTITALMIPLLAMGMNILPGAKAFVGFADPIIFLFFGGFALAGAIHEQKLDTWIARKIFKYAKGRLWLALVLVFLTTAILSMWMSNTATAVMMIPLVMSLMATLDAEKYKSTIIFAVLGVAYSASIGGMGTLVGSPPNAIAAQALNMSFAQWFKIGIPIVCILGLIIFGIMWLYFRPKLGLKLNFEDLTKETDTPDALTPSQIRTIIIFALTASCWMGSNWISSLCGGIAAIDSLIGVASVVALTLVNVTTWKSIAKETDWGVLWLFGGGLTLSSILMKTGAAQFLALQTSHLTEGQSTLVVLIIISAFVKLLTEFCSNTATATLLTPIMLTLAPVIGIPATPLILLVGFGSSCAFMLPVSTPPNAIAFATGKVPQSEMIRVGIIINIVAIISMSLIAKFFWL